MNTLKRALALCLLIALPSVAASAASPNQKTLDRLAALGFHVFPTPVELPKLTAKALPDQAGKTGGDLNLATLAGKVTLLNFWATWCPPCKQEMPSIERLSVKLKGTAFRVAAISVGEKTATVRDFIARTGYTFPVYLDADGSLGAAFASQGIPTTYILDKTGKAIAGTVGAREYDGDEIVSILTELAK
jgi:thiol-disulfide isomerase/thioredoxin